MSRLNPTALTATLLLAWGCACAMAQTPAKPAKPATPAAAPATGAGKTLDGSAPSSGKIMSINELKECLKRQDDLKARGAELERQRAELDADRQKIDQETAAVKLQQEDVAKRNQALKDFNARMKVFGDSVASWNVRMAEANEATGMAAERKRRELSAELVTLQKTEATYKAEGETLLSSVQDAANKVNALADVQQKLASDWNDRNAKLNDAARAYEDGRVDWRAECGNRRYREDDEKALRSAK